MLSAENDVCGCLRLFHLLYLDRKSRHIHMDIAIHHKCALRYKAHSRMVYVVDHWNKYWSHLCSYHDNDFIIFRLLLLLYRWNRWTFWFTNDFIKRDYRIDSNRKKSTTNSKEIYRNEKKARPCNWHSCHHIWVSWCEFRKWIESTNGFETLIFFWHYSFSLYKYIQNGCGGEQWSNFLASSGQCHLFRFVFVQHRTCKHFWWISNTIKE